MSTRKSASTAGGLFNTGLPTKGATARKPPVLNGQTCDSLWISIARSARNIRQFQVKLERPGAPSRYGRIEQPDTVGATAIQELRRGYERQLQIMHELALAG